MRSVYESVDDIDLFVAGLKEKPLPNAVLGPTFAGIFAAQFLNLKRTDRFFYNNVDQPTSFNSSNTTEFTRTIKINSFNNVSRQINWQRFEKSLWRESFAITATAQSPESNRKSSALPTSITHIIHIISFV